MLKQRKSVNFNTEGKISKLAETMYLDNPKPAKVVIEHVRHPIEEGVQPFFQGKCSKPMRITRHFGQKR